MHRRTFLAGMTGIAAWGALQGQAHAPVGLHREPEPVAPAALQPQSSGQQVRVPVLAADGPALSLALSVEQVFQGGALLVLGTPAISGEVTFRGRSQTLEPDGAGVSTILGIPPGEEPGEAILHAAIVDALGSVAIERTITVLATQWTVDYIELPPGVGGLLDPAIVETETALLTSTYGGRTARRWSGPWASPIGREPLPADISGYFGEQRSFDGSPPTGHHGGTDFGLDAGTAVYAVHEGVAVVARALDVRGNMVILDHGGGIFSGYAHLESIGVNEGDVVAQGAMVGTVGTTGLSTGPHLHWEMAVGGVLVDGLRWLDGSQGF